ncbi:LacI family DNA-binding transcriptional regulator [Hirschia litorea]|uniref:LacI family DNA-binding transcriptional regulator n=1 Tax=Hirschia litorea TaxID=1199156 RepID=A0ABW2INT9_9PROT
MSTKVTIKTIAADLGVSHMTVSRALSSHANVRPELREKILKRAEELGYVRNAAALAMRGDTLPSIGLLIPNLRNEFYAHFADALTSICNEQSINLLIHLTHDDIAKEEHALTLLKEAQAQTVIMVPSPAPVHYTSTHTSGLNIIQFIRTHPRIDQPSNLLIDDAPAILEALQHLSQSGHSKIAYIGADKSLASGQQRYDNFLKAAQACQIDITTSPILTGPPTRDYGYNSVRHILETSPQTTALICGGFDISVGATNALLKDTGSLPAHFGFVGYGDPSFYQWIGNGISAIALPMESLARKAIEHLMTYKMEKHFTPLVFTQTAEFIRRNSC